MSMLPDSLVLERHRDLRGRLRRPWGRWLTFAIVMAVPLLALANVFGQRPRTVEVDSPQASLELYAPAQIRPGLLWQARFTIRAHEDIRSAALVLSSGWLESMQVNTLEPSPVEETSLDGSPAFVLGRIPAGETYTFYMQFQVDPTNIGRRKQTVVLYDGGTAFLTIDRTLTVFP